MDINRFKTRLGGGVYPSLFRIDTNSTVFSDDDKQNLAFLCTAANLPPSNLGEITVNHRGRQVYLPGFRTFEPWTITILSDEDMSIRTAFEKWVDRLDGARDHVSDDVNFNLGTNTGLFSNWTVTQLDRQGKAIKAYRLDACFPTSVSDIALSAESTDLASFNVTLRYQYHRTTGLPFPNGGVGKGINDE
tara:strand:- start:412 stop:981 length:570 start_codon:yes stop_codon:yes gene_type:complete